jgi:hypothetical protein
MRCRGCPEIRIESCSDVSHEDPRLVRNVEDVPVASDQSMFGKDAQAGKGRQQLVRIMPVGPADLADIDGEIAHDPFDQRGPEAVVRRQCIAFDGREFATRHARAVGAQRRLVLNVTLGQPPDGGRAEADKRIAEIRRVALEAPAQELCRILGDGGGQAAR